MNYMYNLSIIFHNYSVISLLVLIGLNFVLLFKAEELLPYRKKMAYMTPLIAIVLASILFTGTIMMASKHLHFTLANIAMIIIGTTFIVLEVKRVKPLKYLKNVPHAIPAYRDYAKKIISAELIIVMIIAVWMWI
ncbi:hypothetical protein [Sulfurimonas sp. HSL-1716]|uniref:hypothetical protein n=1 Tax=Hydrocurvibacter sulfurireducens TaxID=3131937 RepID=UPI0031F7FBF7